MEKVIAALWAGEDRQHFNARLLAELPDALRREGATRIRLNIRDSAVEPGSALIQQWQTPQQDAVVQFWLPSANARFRQAIDGTLAHLCTRFAAWLAVESTIIPNETFPPRAGERCAGWSQASFITFRPDLDRHEAISFWHSHHTRVAIETQANFEYVQNLLVLPLTENTPAYDAFVEECFPAEALTDSGVFFDAAGNAEKLKANVDAMMKSCERFIEFGRIDIIPTSQYDFG